MNNLIKVVITILVACIGYVLPTNANNIPLNGDNFAVKGKDAKFVTYKGEKSLLLNNGGATINDMSFVNGVIEYDVAFKKQRGFIGVDFRQQDSKNSEKFYIRPHQSGNPDASQYTPVFNGLSAWQLYPHGFAGKVNYNFDDWNHIKIIVAGKTGEVYINDMQKPVFSISEFIRPIESGSIRFYAERADAYIANVSIVKNNESQVLSTSAKTDVPSLKDYVSKWNISNSFSGNDLDNTTELNQQKLAKMDWQTLNTDNYGVLNMARVQGINQTKNTAFATFSIDSDRAQTKALHFGYSDKVRVYVNNKLVYAGNNQFRSRDYRYLGTMGLFDTIYLPLNTGKNNVIFAVSELFGGWGIMAKFDDIQPCIKDN